MPRPDKHVFVCAQSRPPGHPRGSCAEKGGGDVLNEFMNAQQARGLFNIQITATGCMGPCLDGATVLVYPEGVMYGKVTKDDVAKIIDEHLLGGTPVESLLMPAEIWS
jgi:(2Fe-2S) ferredoxin